MKKILLFVSAFLLNNITYAKEFHVLELNELKVDFMNYFPGGRDPLVTQNGLENRELGNELDLSFNSSVMTHGYWDVLVHSTTDRYANTHLGGQFRSLGLKMEMGVHITSYLDVYYYHHSQHDLDYTLQFGGFPVADSIGIHLYLYSNNHKEGLF